MRAHWDLAHICLETWRPWAALRRQGLDDGQGTSQSRMSTQLVHESKNLRGHLPGLARGYTLFGSEPAR
jgi:hypothetical protein